VPLLRIREVAPLEGFCLRLTLTDGSVVERDVTDLLLGPMFETMRKDTAMFRQVTVESGTAVWPNGADLCPDVLIWGGPPPKTSAVPLRFLTLKSPTLAR
jgi:Protein of unknown function (DUF2442)